MRYLENTLKFLGRFYLLALPLYILSALPALIGGAANMGNYGKLMKQMTAITKDPMLVQDPTVFLGMFSGLFMAAAGAGMLAFILKLIITPATYGMIHKAFGTNRADLNDFVPALKDNIVKYILYLIAALVVWVLFAIAAGVVFLVLGLVTAVIKWLGIVLMVLAFLCVVAAAIALGVLISLWFPAMVIDNLDIMAALKKSIDVAKENFWTLLGITLLIWLAGAVAGGVLSLFGLIPLIGSLIVSVVPAITGFVTIVFYMMVYRDRVHGEGTTL